MEMKVASKFAVGGFEAIPLGPKGYRVRFPLQVGCWCIASGLCLVLGRAVIIWPEGTSTNSWYMTRNSVLDSHIHDISPTIRLICSLQITSNHGIRPELFAGPSNQ
jgi:hypothetical protein